MCIYNTIECQIQHYKYSNCNENCDEVCCCPSCPDCNTIKQQKHCSRCNKIICERYNPAFIKK